MTKKLFFTLSIITFLASCGTRRNVVQDPATFDKGVVINGVRWATRNVDTFGFVQNPEDAGRFFQWNRTISWCWTYGLIEWEGSIPVGTEWYEKNNPCPFGWRVPTLEELQSLYNAIGEWTTQNGVNGRLFGDAPYQIFLPATGFRHFNDGALNLAGEVGYYWSSTQRSSTDAMFLWFDSENSFVGDSRRKNGFNIRCVAK